MEKALERGQAESLSRVFCVISADGGRAGLTWARRRPDVFLQDRNTSTRRRGTRPSQVPPRAQRTSRRPFRQTFHLTDEETQVSDHRAGFPVTETLERGAL